MPLPPDEPNELLILGYPHADFKKVAEYLGYPLGDPERVTPETNSDSDDINRDSLGKYDAQPVQPHRSPTQLPSEEVRP